MIALDTDVLSALMRPELNAAVVRWLDHQDRDSIRMTVVSLHELAYGLAKMPQGKRKRALTAGFMNLQQSALGLRILLLDPESARRAAVARAAAERATGHCDVPDALIAGIALANGSSVATRNIADFMHFGVPVIDPWATPAR